MDTPTTTARLDGRSATSLRSISCELSTLRDANGSAIWKSGGTTVFASCHGPTAPRQAQTLPSSLTTTTTMTTADDNINSNVADATAGGESFGGSVLVQVLLPPSLRHGAEWEIFLTNILTGCVRTQAYPPNTIIQIVLQVPSDDGSVLAACLHASVSALMDASVELNYLPVAITCLVSSSSLSSNNNSEDEHHKSFGLDPTAWEEQQEGLGMLALCVVPMASSSSNDRPRLGGIHASGVRISAQDVLRCWNLATEASKAVTAFWRLVMAHKHEQHSKTLFAGASGELCL